MSLGSSQILSYCEEVTKFASQGPVSFGIDECVAEVPFGSVRAGYIPREDARRLVDDYVSRPGRSLDRAGRIPVAVSLRTLVFDDPRRKSAGLLLISAMLDVNGRLSFVKGLQFPWIPLDRLSGAGLDARTLVVSSLEEYRGWQRSAQDRYRSLTTWGGYVDLARSMYAEIAHVDEAYLASAPCSVDGRNCCIKAILTLDGSAIPSEVFAARRRSSMPRPAALEEVLRRQGAPELPEHVPDLAEAVFDRIKDRRGSIRALSGMPDDAYRAISALSAGLPWHLGVVEAPMGECASKLACALACAAVTDAAVRGADLPRIVLAAPDASWREDLSRQVSRYLGTGSSRLATPWVPGRRAEWSRRLREMSYLDEVEKALGTRPLSVANAAMVIGQRLRRIDQVRCELVDAYREMQLASDLVAKQADGLLSLAKLRRELLWANGRLEFWTGLLKSNPPRKKVLSSGLASQRGIIASKAEPGEKIARTYANLDDVCHAYRAEIAELEEKIRLANQEAARLDLQIRQHSAYGTVCTELVDAISDACRLDSGERAMLNALFGSDNLTPMRLERALDATVREVEFWLALHLFEARAFEAGRDFSWCEVVAYQQVPARFASSSVADPIDLLVTVGSERMQAPRGLACLALSRRAVVLGDPCGLRPKWEFDPATDHGIGALCMAPEDYDELVAERLSASAPSTLLGCATACAGRTPSVIHERVTCLDAAPWDIRSFRADAFYGSEGAVPAGGPDAPALDSAGQQAQAGARPLPPLQVHRVRSDARSVGNSLNNPNEAKALVRWVEENLGSVAALDEPGRTAAPAAPSRDAEGGRDARGALGERPARPVLVLTPFTAQRHLIAEELLSAGPEVSRRCEVRTVRELGSRRSPVVALSMADSVSGIEQRYFGGVDAILAAASAAASDCLALFCDTGWVAGATGTPGRSLVQLAAHASLEDGPSDAGAPLDDRDEAGSATAGVVADTSLGEPASSMHDDTEADDVAAASAHDAAADSAAVDATGAAGHGPEAPASAAGTPRLAAGAGGDATARGYGDATARGAGDVTGATAGGAFGPAVTAGSSGRAGGRLSLEELLRELRRTGSVIAEVDPAEAYRWLEEDGLVMRARARNGRIAWVPTERGLEGGIRIEQGADDGMSCSFLPSSRGCVLASVLRRTE